MPWLKYQSAHAYGLGQPEYVEFLTDDLDDVKNEIRAELYDGIREPVFEILDHLPPAVLEQKIRRAEIMALAWARQQQHLMKQRAH